MAGKGLKPTNVRPSAREAMATADAVAREARLPPAALPDRAPPAGLVQINFRVRPDLGDQLADRARAEGTTQKILILPALAASGFIVHPDDLKSVPVPRRRG